LCVCDTLLLLYVQPASRLQGTHLALVFEQVDLVFTGEEGGGGGEGGER